jgi:hypothetical protein
MVIATAFTTILIGVCGGCSNNNKNTSAVLRAGETPGVPGRIELYGGDSFAGNGRKLVSQTFTVIDMETGEIAFGPVVLENLLNQSYLRTYIIPKGARLTLTE